MLLGFFLLLPSPPLCHPYPAFPFPFVSPSLSQPHTHSIKRASRSEVKREYTLNHTKPIPLTHTYSLPLLSDPPPSTHLPQTLLVLQRKLPITNKIFFAAAAARNTADVSESGELSRVALGSLRAIRSRQGADDPAWVASRDGIGWDVLLWC
jgi:hypothetical protein